MKKLLIIILIFLFLLVGAGLFLIWNGDALVERYRPEIEALASESLGRSVTFEKATFSIFPKAKISLSEIKISKKDPGDPSATLDGIDLVVKILPLIQKEFDITYLVLKKPKIVIPKEKNNVEKNPNGERSAFRGLKSKEKVFIAELKSEIKPDPKSQKTMARLADAPTALTVRIEGVRILEGEILLETDKGAPTILASNLNLDAAINLDGSLLSISNLNGKTKILGLQDITVSSDKLSYSLDTLDLDIKAAEISTQGGVVNVSTNLNFQRKDGLLKFNTEGFDLSSLPTFLLHTKDFTITSPGKVTTKASIKLNPGFVPQGSGDISLTGLFAKGYELDLGPVEGRANFNSENQRIKLEEVTVGLPKEKAAVTISGDILIQEKRADLKIKTKQIELSTIESALKKFAPELNKYALSGEITSDLNSVINFASGVQQLNGSVAISKGKAVYEHVQLSDAKGTLNIKMSPSEIKLTSDRFVARVNNNQEFIISGLSTDISSGRTKFQVQNDGVEIGALLLLVEPFLKETVAPLKQYEMKGLLTPDLSVSMTSFKSQPEISGDLKITSFAGKFDNYKISFPVAALKLTKDERGAQLVKLGSLPILINDHEVNLQTDIILTEEATYLRGFEGSGFGGSFNGSLKLSKLQPGQLSTRFNASGLSLSQILSLWDKESSYKLSGKLKSVAIDVNGKLGANLFDTLSGTANLELVEGLIKDLNVAREVLTKIEGLPFLAGSLISKVPPEFNKYLEPNDTRIHSMNAALTFDGGRAVTKDSILVSDLFSSRANGVFLSNSTMKVDSVIFFEKEFSLALANKIRELAVLLNRDGILAVPVEVKGKIPDVKVLPDISQLLKISATRAVEQEAGKFIGNILGLDRNDRNKEKQAK